MVSIVAETTVWYGDLVEQNAHCSMFATVMRKPVLNGARCTVAVVQGPLFSGKIHFSISLNFEKLSTLSCSFRFSIHAGKDSIKNLLWPPAPGELFVHTTCC
jgi:hypothetical protein